jgi:hypothetical protein
MSETKAMTTTVVMLDFISAHVKRLSNPRDPMDHPPVVMKSRSDHGHLQRMQNELIGAHRSQAGCWNARPSGPDPSLSKAGAWYTSVGWRPPLADNGGGRSEGNAPVGTRLGPPIAISRSLVACGGVSGLELPTSTVRNQTCQPTDLDGQRNTLGVSMGAPLTIACASQVRGIQTDPSDLATLNSNSFAIKRSH